MMKNKDKKGGRKGRLLLRKAIRTILIVILSISCWEIGKKQISYKKSINTYNKIEQEKNNTDNVQDFLSRKGFDWITVTGTAIDYPLVKGKDNEYYISHDYLGNDDIGGAIFYDAYDEPYNKTMTTIYGHSMRNGTMFNNLHYFQKDHDRFRNSNLLIHTELGLTAYKPLGYYVTDSDFFYKDLDDKLTKEAVDLIEKESDYFIQQDEIEEGAHIIALYTCDYSQGNGRLIVFYIEEVN
jgi:sortase B